MSEIECGKCGSICEVDGGFPKFFAWCDECQDYVAGFDADDYSRDMVEFWADKPREQE